MDVDAAVEGVIATMRKVVGDAPPSCPWRAFYDPLVRDVIEAYPFFESGQLGEWWGDDPPWLIVQAVREYHGAIRRVQSHDDDEREKKREREREAAKHRNAAR